MMSAPNNAGTNSLSCAKLACSRSRKVMVAPFGSVSRAALHVEDRASMTARTDEPLPAPRIPEAERSPADLANGETHVAPRTGRSRVFAVCLPDRPQFVWSVLHAQVLRPHRQHDLAELFAASEALVGTARILERKHG